MNKIVFLGDLHFDAKNSSLIFLEHVKKFFELFFFPYIIENNITTIVQVGDIFDRRKGINFNILYQVRKYFFDRLQEMDVEFISILGNHDIFYRQSLEISSPELLLSDYKNVTIINKPTEYTFGEVKFLLLPWICQENQAECLEAVKTTSATHLVAHLEMAGYEMQKGILCEHGMETKLFENFDLVISGHFHHMSYIGNIFYLGTPYQITWSDYNDPRGMHVFDVTTRELSFIKNEYELFYKIHYDDVENPKIHESTFPNISGSYIKVIVKNKSNPYVFDLFIDALEKSGAFDIQVVEDHFNLNLEDDETILENVEDTATVLSKVVDQLDNSSNKNDLKIFLNTLLLEAQNRE